MFQNSLDILDSQNITLDLNNFLIPQNNKLIILGKESNPIGYWLTDFIDIDYTMLVGVTFSDIDFDMFEKEINDYISDKNKFNDQDLESKLDYVEFNKSLVFQHLFYLFAQHIYTSCFIPYVKNNYRLGLNAALIDVWNNRNKFKALVECCFAIDCQDSLYSNKTAKERYYTFLQHNPEFKFPDISLCVDYLSIEKDLNINVDNFNLDKTNARKPEDIFFAYRCKTLEDMLFLEFYLMLENNIKLKRCNYCGKYFPFKGKDTADNCTRIHEESNLTCQQLATQDTFQSKLMNSDAMKLYLRYYKRFSARVKVNTVKENDFKKWKLKASALRDDCVNDKISIDDYYEFLEGSFKK